MVSTAWLFCHPSFNAVADAAGAAHSGGYVMADALLVESQRLFHGGGALGKQVVVGAMDARVVLKE